MCGLNGAKLTSNIKVVFTEITSGVSGLDDHLLSGCRPGREGEFVAGAAPIGLFQSFDADSGVTVGQVCAHAPGNLVVAHERSSAGVTPRTSSEAGQNLVLSIAGVDGVRYSCLFFDISISVRITGKKLRLSTDLASPSTTRLAAIPVTCSLTDSS